MSKKLISWVSIGMVVFSTLAFAQDMSANEKKVAEFFKKAIKDSRNIDLNPLARQTEIKDIYEITVDKRIQGYTNLEGSFILSGDLINPKNLENLTSKREEELNRVDIKAYH